MTQHIPRSLTADVDYDARQDVPFYESHEFDAPLIVSLATYATTKRTLSELREKTPTLRTFHAIDWVYDIVRALRTPRED